MRGGGGPGALRLAGRRALFTQLRPSQAEAEVSDGGRALRPQQAWRLPVAGLKAPEVSKSGKSGPGSPAPRRCARQKPILKRRKDVKNLNDFEEHSVKKKKKKDKHSKKAKKEKKKKSKKQKCEKNESSASSSSSEDEWIEAVPSQAAGKEKAWKVEDEKSERKDSQLPQQRDEWMTVDFMFAKTVSSSSLKAEKETRKKIEREKAHALDQSRLLEKELNPYWKDGGTGLPPEDCGASSVTKVSVIEDGGLSWLRKSYQRMKEQAEKQNRNFEDIVAERYGSMEIFLSKLEEAEKAASAREDCRRERWRKPACSDKAESRRESRKSDVAHSKSSRDECRPAELAGSCRDKYSDDGKESGPGSLETWRRESNPRPSQEFSSLRNRKPIFLRPSDDEELPYPGKGRQIEPSCSASPLAAQDSLPCGFRKPTEMDEESPIRNLSDGKEGERKQSQQKPPETSYSVDRRHVSQNGRLRGDCLEKVHPQDTESSFAGSSSDDEPTCILSVDEKNKLGARIIKAEMMGNMELAEQLKAQLEKANKIKETVTQASSKKPGTKSAALQEVVLVRTDSSGRVWPVDTPAKALEAEGGMRKRQAVFDFYLCLTDPEGPFSCQVFLCIRLL